MLAYFVNRNHAEKLQKKIRNFAFYIAQTGYKFKELYKEMKPYALYSLSQLLFVIDEPNQSFMNLRELTFEL